MDLDCRSPKIAKTNKKKPKRPNPLAIPEIVNLIFKSLPYSDLKTCRAVSRQWNFFGIEHLTSRNNTYINISTSRKARDFYPVQKKAKKYGSSSILPQVRNLMLDAKIPSDPAFKDLISRSGYTRNIKRLIITNLVIDLEGSYKNYMEKFYWFLFHDVHQVEYMEINCIDSQISPVSISDFPNCWTWNRNNKYDYNNNNNTQQLHLTKLKVFKFYRTSWLRNYFSPFISAIIEAARNLQELHVPVSSSRDVHLIERLLETKRTHLLKELVFDLDHGENIEHIERFAQTHPQVQIFQELSCSFMFSIYDEEWNTSLGNSLTKIFASSQNSLRILKMDSLGFLEGFQLPRMTNVTELLINVDDYAHLTRLTWDGPVVPRLFHDPRTFCQDNFPNLKHLRITWKSNLRKEHPWGVTFGEAGFVIESVEHLTLHSVASRGHWLPKLSNTFPNVKKLEVEYIHYSDDLYPFLGKVYRLFPKLEHLSMRHMLGFYIQCESYMDSCVTGMTRHQCQQHLKELNNASKDKLSGSGPRPAYILSPPPPSSFGMCFEKPNPSMLNMKNLKTVTFRPSPRVLCYSDKRGGNDEGKLQLFSPVASLFVFDLMPNLEVITAVEED